MDTDLILPLSMVIGTLGWALVLVWYVHPLLRDKPLRAALLPILLLHSFRYIGLMFLIPGVTADALDPRFAHPAAYGDLVAALLALAALAMLRIHLRFAMAAVWTFNIFNIWGSLDLLNAVTRGVLYTSDGHLGATYWIPALLVPLLLVTHGYVFFLLLKRPRNDRQTHYVTARDQQPYLAQSRSGRH